MNDEYLVLDGGLATLLVRDGFEDLNHDPLWSSGLLIKNPDAVIHAHLSFLEAGSDVIETNSYQASIDSIQKHAGVNQKEAADLITLSAQLACTARDEFWEKNKDPQRRRPLVAGSVGPYGACQCDGSEYTGKYVDSMSKQDLVKWHKPTVEALLAGGVDLLAFDTVPAQMEAEAIVELLSSFTDVKAWISFSCKDDTYTCHGELLSEAVSVVAGCEQVVGVGINCLHPDYVESLLRHAVPAKADKKMIVYPNSGELWKPDHSWHGKESLKKTYEYVPRWLALGAQWIGGCCRIFPEDITDIRKAMDQVINKKETAL